MLNKIRDMINQYHMLSKGDKVVVGVSGGADSMCLLHVLTVLSKEFELSLFVVHVNHGLRGEEAERDQLVVEQYCREHQIEYRVERVQVATISKNMGISLEEAGRITRYRIFDEELERQKADKIAVAHHKNDNAETVLFQMFRGTGITGMAGIRPVRGSIIRPLLAVTRREIEDYLEEHKIVYCIDSTNLTEEYSRNVIRNVLLPLATEKINERAKEHICAVAEQLSEIEVYLQKQTESAYQRIVTSGSSVSHHKLIISRDKLIHEDIVIQKRVIREVLYQISGFRKDIEAVHIAQVLELTDKQVGRRKNLPYHIIAERGYDCIDIYNMTETDEMEQSKEYMTDELERRLVNGEQITIVLSEISYIVSMKVHQYDKNESIPKNKYTKWFDYDKIKDTLTIRTPKEGDFIQINTAGGRKLIKDYFVDSKVPKSIRKAAVLITAGSHVLWVIGKRAGEGFYVDDKTKRILSVTLQMQS